MRLLCSRRLFRRSVFLLALIMAALSLPLGTKAQDSYNTSYSSMRYNYGGDLYEQYPDVPYVAWLLDFASDQIHGYGTYEEVKGKGNGSELDVVCSTLIYYALYCTGYNVPQYINISKDDDITAAKSRIQNVRNNFCAETMYSKRLMTKAGFQAIPITDSTKMRDLQVGDILWIFTKKLNERFEDDESAYSEMRKKGLYYHAEVVVEAGKNSYVTVGAHGREGCRDKYPGDNPAVDNIDEVCLKRYKNLHYDGRTSLPKYTMIYRPTKTMPRGAMRPYQPALIQKSRDVKYRITGRGEVSIQNAPALITDTAIIGTRVTVEARPDEGYVLDSLKVKNDRTGTYLKLSSTGSFKMPTLKWGGSVTIRAVFKQAEEGEGTGKSGWSSSSDGRSYFIDGEKATGFQSIGGRTYYFNKKGIMQTGWKTIGGKKYCFTGAGVMRSGWQTLGGKTYYFDETGVMQTGFLHLNGDTYYLGDDGFMRKGWRTIDGGRYYFSNGEGREGTMLVGIRRLGSHYYYFGPDGRRQTGLLTLEDGTYYFRKSTHPSGKMQTGWKTIGKGRYYFGTDGKALTGWQTIGGGRYYLSEKGRAQTGWQTIDGEKYYFDKKGLLLTGFQTIGGIKYYLGADGKLRRGFFRADGKRYLAGEDGGLREGFHTLEDGIYYTAGSGRLRGGWRSQGGKRCYFGSDYRAVTGWQTIDGKTYYFDQEGALVRGWLKLEDGTRFLGEDGVLRTGLVKAGDHYYYLGEDGIMLTSSWAEIDGRKYYFGKNGRAYTGTRTVDGAVCIFDARGRLKE